MGAHGTKLARSALANKEVRVLLLGVDGTGKTNLMYKLNLGDLAVAPVPLDYYANTSKYKNMTVMSVSSFDYGGRGGGRYSRRLFYNDSAGIVFVVDASNRELIDEARAELDEVLGEPLMADKPLVVFVNPAKQTDATDAMTVTEVQAKLGLDAIPSTRKWKIQDGFDKKDLSEGMDWLSMAITGKIVEQAITLPTATAAAKPENGLSVAMSKDDLKEASVKFEKKKPQSRLRAFTGMFRTSAAA